MFPPPSHLLSPSSPLHSPSAPSFPCSAGLQLGGILTVADDLLKNDGQKFLEMMEQLADRRMQRAEEAAAELDAISEDGEGDEDELDEEEDEDVSTREIVV